MGGCVSRLGKCFSKVKGGPTYEQVAPGDDAFDLDLVSDAGSDWDDGFDDFGDEDDNWGNKSKTKKVSVVVNSDSKEPSPSPTPPSAASVIPRTRSSSQVSGPNELTQRVQPSREPEKTEQEKEAAQPAEEIDFFSNLGMGVSYKAPQRAMAKKKKSPPLAAAPAPVVPSNHFNLDSLLGDEAGIADGAGWGDGDDLDINLGNKRAPKGSNKKKAGLGAVAVDFSDYEEDIDIDLV